ncbi:cytochrome P450 [Astrocystis sublimbata]|nr:cytochrome P450 [Astrocystis sublimbata]
MVLNTPFPTLALFALCASTTYIALLFGYRLFLHPLRDYPGPFLAKISDAYGGIQAGYQSVHVKTREDLLKYGPVIRYGPNKLIFNSVKAVQDIYHNDRVCKSHLYKHSAVVDGEWHIFNVVDKAVHRLRRKLVGKSISERSMRIFEPTMQQEIDTFLATLTPTPPPSQSQAVGPEKGTPVPINMSEHLKRLGIDTIALLAFGFPLQTQTSSQYRFLLAAHKAGHYRVSIFMNFPLIARLRIWQFFELFLAKQVAQYWATMSHIVASRVSEPIHARHDLYSLVADERDPDNNNERYLSDREIWTEAAFFFPAGGETTSTALSAAFFYLAHNRRCYEKLAREVRAAFNSEDEIKGGPALFGCSYLRACLDEAMRMSPPAPSPLWREFLPEQVDDPAEPWVVDGHVIPPGVQVGVSAYAIHHDEAVFPDSFAFKPERWDDEERKQVMNAAFQAFSSGPRGCAGKAMAYLQASLVLAKTFWRFDFEPASADVAETMGGSGAGGPGLGKGREREGEFQIYEIVAATHDGPCLVFRERGC